MPEIIPKPVDPPGPKPLKRHNRLREADVNRLVADYLAGKTIKELAAQYKVDPVTATAWLKRHGVEIRRNHRKLTDVQVSKAAELLAGGSTISELARQLNVARTTLRTELRRRSA